MPAKKSSPAQYRTGAAARLAGIPIETLRVWERRYKVVDPARSPRAQKLYTLAEVDRLRTIKWLTDNGHAISTIAPLPMKTLEAMAKSYQAVLAAQPTSSITALTEINLVLIGAALSQLQPQAIFQQNPISLVGSYPDLASALAANRLDQASTIFIEIPTLEATTVATLSALKMAAPQATIAVLYHVASSAIVRKIRFSGYPCLKARIKTPSLEALLSLTLTMASTSTPLLPHQITATTPQFMAGQALTSPAIAHMHQQLASLSCTCARRVGKLIEALHAEADDATSNTICSVDAAADNLVYRALEKSVALACQAVKTIMTSTHQQQAAIQPPPPRTNNPLTRLI
jgi:hypothetical protein